MNLWPLAAWIVLYLVAAVILLWDRKPCPRGALIFSPFLFPMMGMLAVILAIPIAAVTAYEWLAARWPVLKPPSWLVRLGKWLDHPVQVLPPKEKP